MFTRKIIMVILVLLVLAGVEKMGWARNTELRPGLAKSTVKKDKIILEYEFAAPSISKKGGYDLLTIEGLKLHERVGAPIVPVRPVEVLIPFGNEVIGTNVIVTKSEELPNTYKLPPGQKSYPLSYKGVVKRTKPNPEIYGKSEQWPGINHKELSTQSKRGYQVFSVNLFPMQYSPSTGKVSFAKKMRLEIELGVSKKKQILRPTKEVKKSLERKVDNPATIEIYPSTSADYPVSNGTLSIASKKSTEMSLGMEMSMGWSPGEPNSPLNNPTCPYYGKNWKYIVITSPNLADSNNIPDANYSFKALCDEKEERGISAGIVDTNWIYTSYDGNRPDGEEDNQTRIRNFIIDAYNVWDTNYVLLGGNTDIIPARMFLVNGISSTPLQVYMPVDMYYGCVEPNECTFDYNADGNYGRPTDGVGGGEVDLWADIYVGRAAVADENEVVNFVRKTLNYNSANGGHWGRIAMLGEHLGFGGVSEYAKNSIEQIRLGGEYDGYFTYGFENCGYPGLTTEGYIPGSSYFWPLYDKDSNYPPGWSGTFDLIPLMNSGVHIFNHFGHAKPFKDMKIYTTDEEREAKGEDPNICGLLVDVNNTEYFFAYSQGCHPGSFDEPDCFAEVVTTMEHGAFAVIMNARYGFGKFCSTDGPSNRFNRQFWNAALSEDISEISLGQANQESKEDNYYDIDGTNIRWCYYELNLFGDPETRFLFYSSKGSVVFDSDYYSCSDEISINLVDIDLESQSTVDVNVATSGGDLETVTLDEADYAWIFSGTVSTDSGDVNQGDGILQVSHGETITVTYSDADDGSGSPASPNDIATVDCAAPVISNLEIDATMSIPVVTFQTDEPAIGRVLCDVNCAEPYAIEADESGVTTSHSIQLEDLDPNTNYFFIVEATDEVGNAAVDNNNGSCYTFTTIERYYDLYVPSQFSTIQSAIDASWKGDTVWIAEGTYTGLGNRDIDFKGLAITVSSNDPNDPNVVESTIIDCNGTRSEPYRGFYFHDDEDYNSIVSGLAIKNGYGDLQVQGEVEYYAGGAIFCINSSPKISKCVITNNTNDNTNTDTAGGGIACYEGGNPEITNCIIENNTAYLGGGIIALDGKPTITDCILNNNIATSGGGCYLKGSDSGTGSDSSMITRCTIKDNEPSQLRLFGSSPVISNCIISCTEGYGILCQFSSSPLVTNNEIKGGTSGVSLMFGSNPYIKNNLICGNNIGVLFFNSSPIIENDTIVNNKWGIAQEGALGNTTIGNCILWGNQGDLDESLSAKYSCIEDSFDANDPNFIGSIDDDPCLINACDFVDRTEEDGTTTTLIVYDASLYEVNDVIEYNNDGVIRTVTDVNNDSNTITIDVGLDANSTESTMVYNWGVGATNLEEDYHIRPSSPCLNTGDPNFVPDSNETDIDGEPRIMSPDSNDILDMGADEVGCLSYDGQEHADWVAWGSPDCWCYPRQCRGDTDGKKTIIFWVYSADLSLLQSAYGMEDANLPADGICADLDHKRTNLFRVYSPDLSILQSYYGKSEANVPECGSPPDPNYNFWMSP